MTRHHGEHSESAWLNLRPYRKKTGRLRGLFRRVARRFKGRA